MRWGSRFLLYLALMNLSLTEQPRGVSVCCPGLRRTASAPGFSYTHVMRHSQALIWGRVPHIAVHSNPTQRSSPLIAGGSRALGSCLAELLRVRQLQMNGSISLSVSH